MNNTCHLQKLFAYTNCDVANIDCGCHIIIMEKNVRTYNTE